MKRIMLGLVGAVILSCIVFGGIKIVEHSKQKSETQELKVSSDKVNTYEVTKIDKGMIFSKALDNISNDNQGLFLEVNNKTSKIGVGDKLEVTFGNDVGDYIKDVKIVK